MLELRFEWDARKSASNAKKHKVTFEEARPAFADPNGLVIDDPDHSEEEERFILLRLELRSAPARGLSRLPGGCGSHHLRPQGNAARGFNLSKEQMTMRKEYDFANARKNPHAARLKKQVTIRLDPESIAYFKAVSSEVGIPYQSLINLYLRDCVAARRRPRLDWPAAA